MNPAAPIYGNIGFLHFTADIEGADEGFLFRYAEERHEKLEELVRKQIRDILGSDFEARIINLRPGSVEIYVGLAAVGTFFMAFSRYESFIKSVNLLVSQLKGAFRRFFEGATPGSPDIEVDITGSWNPSENVLAANQILRVSSRRDLTSLLMLYLILSHAALLGLVCWLLVNHLK